MLSWDTFRGRISNNYREGAAEGCELSMIEAPICRWPRALTNPDSILAAIKSLLQPE